MGGAQVNLDGAQSIRLLAKGVGYITPAAALV